MTRRRFIADTWTSSKATLVGDQAKHLARVLRAEPGQIYDVVAGGFLHRSEIVTVEDTEVVFRLHEELESDSALPLHLLLAIFKFDHFEWAVEKATELGVARITPILARRTEKHLAQVAEKRSERWRRIALESSKQSRRIEVPEIMTPTTLMPALEQEHSGLRLLLSETEQQRSILAALAGAPADAAGKIALAVGPEGGWTPEEMALFHTHGWHSVTLGPGILRAETAAIAAIAILSTQA